MKKYFLIQILLLFCLISFAQIGYKCGSSFIELHKDNSSLYFIQGKSPGQIDRIVETALKRNNGEKVVARLADNACIVNSTALADGNYMSDIFVNGEGHKIIILPRFAIKMKEGYDIKDVLMKYGQGLVFDEKEINIFKVDCLADNALDVMAINSEINELESVEWCEPMMIGEMWKYNVYENNQYYLKNTGQNGGSPGIDINVSPVWNYLSADTSLVVAVLDNGVQRNHEDLSGSVLNGMTIDYPDEYGDPINEYANFLNSNEKAHGTACAGIIAAHDNSIGIRGVASGVKILPINIDPYPYPTALLYPDVYYEKIGQAITWAYNTKGASVISCSCGFTDNTYISNAINNAITYGRNGKGTIVVCASGNYLVNLEVAFPANMSNTIAVGAIDNMGVVWDYSCRGNTLDLVAPSGDINLQGDIVTTDRMGNLGYNTYTTSLDGTDLSDMNYTGRFGGTSAACPQVAGVVALMLSAKPNLTVSDVRDILRNTARKLPGMNGANRTDAYGYGLVNTHKAVVGAYNLGINGPDDPCGSSSVYSIANLPTGFTVNWSIVPAVNIFHTSILTTNSPQQNQSSINNHGLSTRATVLYATVKNAEGDTITTLSKRIRSTFDLTFSQDGNTINGVTYPTIPESPVVSDRTIIVNHRCWVHLNSDYFDGMTISHTGASPQIFSDFNGEITFKFPIVTSTQTMYVNGHDGCKSMHLKVLVTPDANIPIPTLDLMPTADGYDIVLNYENNEEVAKALVDKEWTLSIINASTSEKLFSRRVIGQRTSVSTAELQPGIYVLQGIVDGQMCTKKITVK